MKETPASKSLRDTSCPWWFRVLSLYPETDPLLMRGQGGHYFSCALAIFLLLLRNDLVFDLVVGGLRNDLFSYQVGLLRVGTAVDDFQRVGGSDTR